jgi:DNA-binding CsgD family transcriptional regulator
VLVGREAESEALQRLVQGARDGQSGALILRGEAGIGKSALLEYAAASAEGFTVLRGTGVESESELAYAALHQILRPVFDRIDGLPAPQAAALRGAFALSGEAVEERFRVSLGVLGLLAETADERPLLCLVDDAQWLDGASADALVFAARRLAAERVVLLFAARDDPARPFLAPGLPDLRPSPLSGAEARSLVEARAADVAPAVVEWVVENAGGNPLALVELPTGLSTEQRRGLDPLVAAAGPATSVEQAFLRRVEALPLPTRELLVVASAEETCDRATIVRAAAALGLEEDGLVAAEQAGLVRVSAGRIDFHHPLVRSAVYRGAGFATRERAHAALADVLTAESEADRRAWHRASATVGHADDVAADLEATAERARLRSGHAAAAAALERAAALTGDDAVRARRLVGAAEAAWHSGKADRTAGLVESARPLVSDPRSTAELERLRGLLELRRGVLVDAADILMGAAELMAPVDPGEALDMLIDAREAAGWAGDTPRTIDSRVRASALPQSDDPRTRFSADLLEAVGRLYEGDGASVMPLAGDVLVRADEFDDPRLLAWAATLATALGDGAREATLMRRAIANARASGAVDTLTNVLLIHSVVGLLGGRLDFEGEAVEALGLAEAADLPTAAHTLQGLLTVCSAVRGREDECLARSQAAAPALSGGPASSLADWGVGILELSRRRADVAFPRLAAAAAGHPYFAVMALPDLVEAASAAGRRQEAEAAAEAFGAFAQPGAPAWALALAARCRAQLAGPAAAEAAYEEALVLHADGERPLDRARTELLFGELLRRERRRTDSREHLRSALSAFERLGAELWAERARIELRATGETARRRDAATLADLTPQELQIARLVGEGHSNKEVAAQLFLSPRTVEYHLRKVFTKLGIASRAELIRQAIAA